MTVNEMYQRLRAAGLSHAGAVGLLGNIKAESGFDGDGQGRAGEDLLQKPVQALQIPEHAGAFALGGDGAGGTT